MVHDGGRWAMSFRLNALKCWAPNGMAVFLMDGVRYGSLSTGKTCRSGIAPNGANGAKRSKLLFHLCSLYCIFFHCSQTCIGAERCS